MIFSCNQRLKQKSNIKLKDRGSDHPMTMYPGSRYHNGAPYIEMVAPNIDTMKRSCVVYHITVSLSCDDKVNHMEAF